LFYLRLTWLYFIRITRGEFSGIYFNSFGKFRKRYPDYRGRIKTCFREEMLVHLDKVLMRNPLYPEFRSTDVILFNNLPFGSSKAKILDKMGKPTVSSTRTMQAGNGKCWVIMILPWACR